MAAPATVEAGPTGKLTPGMESTPSPSGTQLSMTRSATSNRRNPEGLRGELALEWVRLVMAITLHASFLQEQGHLHRRRISPGIGNHDRHILWRNGNGLKNIGGETSGSLRARTLQSATGEGNADHRESHPPAQGPQPDRKVRRRSNAHARCQRYGQLLLVPGSRQQVSRLVG